MAPPNALRDESEVDDNYHESSDEDFNPTALAADASSSSDDEELPDATTTNVAPRKGKRKGPSLADLDSGDEKTIETAKKRKAKKRKGGEDALLSEDEGGDGGLIKTRAQRRVEQKERKPLARTDGATVDVDALWAQLVTAPIKPVVSALSSTPLETAHRGTENVLPAQDRHPPADTETDLVAIKRIYTFAGQRTTEEKRIPRATFEQYISDGWKSVEQDDTITTPATAAATAPNDNSEGPSDPKFRRPLRRPSRFDPNPTGQVRGLAPEYQLSWPRKTVSTTTVDQENSAAATPTTAVGPGAAPRVEKAQKLNVVDKSRLDWTGYVDKEGIAEELDEHGKAKEAYLGDRKSVV